MVKVFVNGTFDILHIGHLRLLEHAAGLGQYLLVAIDSDARVRQLKGAGRPINMQQDRKEMLESIRWVNEVQVFDSDRALEDIIKAYLPDVMVKGSDYEHGPIIGADWCGRVDFFSRLNDYSTTKKIQDITNR